MAAAGERPSLPTLPSHTPETQIYQGLQHGPAQADKTGSHSPTVAEEGWEASFYSVGAVIVFLPGCRKLDLRAAFPGVLGVGH